jgi:hypothetical protein
MSSKVDITGTLGSLGFLGKKTPSRSPAHPDHCYPLFYSILILALLSRTPLAL